MRAVMEAIRGMYHNYQRVLLRQLLQGIYHHLVSRNC